LAGALGERKLCASANAFFVGGSLRTIRAKNGKHGGFTLVEVIVVLVILAILAAIAIPALTGYIDKASEKKYITQAREHMIAMKTVINEAYAEAGLDWEDGDWPFGSDDVSNSTVYDTPSSLGDNVGIPPIYEPYQKALFDLLGLTKNVRNEPNYWLFLMCGPVDSTIFQCDGFAYFFYPIGSDPANPNGRDFCVVTYKMSPYVKAKAPTDMSTFMKNISYDATQGYTVYNTPTFSG
jgi:prepilin-type N-terminal cleavage/methylation domain-containing protein